MPDHPAAVEKAIFLNAIDIADSGERERYLDEACAGNAPLRERIEQLLGARIKEEEFPEMPDLTSMSAELGVGPVPAVGDAIGYFGEYLLLDEIARGGTGVVFRAKQVSLNRIVALKMLRSSGPGTKDESLSRRFQAEAEAAATLDHPNIVPIYEVGVHDGQDYFSMKLVEGGTLSSRIAEYKTDPRRAAELMVKVCRAVHHAHLQAILHRDIKPGNILVDLAGEPHITDFGLARRLETDLDLTVTGTVMGTPHYMSPEQARGESRRLTVATDVYSLGAVLFELMAGRRPFTGETMVDLLQQVTHSPPPMLRSIRPEADRDMETIVMHCLDKSPQSRYGSAAALADDLEHWLRGEPITARPFGPLERMWKWARRKPALATAAGLAALLAVALVVALAVSRHMVGGALQKSESSLLLARQSLDRAEGRVSYMTTVLPDLLEPVGRLDLLDGPFRNVDEYYRDIPPGARDAGALARHAAFLSRWSTVLWKIGHRRERLDRLEQAAALIREALPQPEGGRDAWLAAAAVFRGLSDAREAFSDLPGAAAATVEAQAAVDKGSARFPGERRFALEQARITLQQIRRLHARGDSAEASALAEKQAPVWRELFAENVADVTSAGRDCREATAEFFREWTVAARVAKIPELEIVQEYERLASEAVRAQPENATVRSEHASALAFLGSTYSTLNDKPRATAYFRQYLQLAQQAAAIDPGSLALKASLHFAQSRYAEVLREEGDTAGERRMLESAVAGLEAIQVRDGALDTYVDYARSGILTSLAQNLVEAQLYDEALPRYEQAIAAARRRTMARSHEWAAHDRLDVTNWICEGWITNFPRHQTCIDFLLRHIAAMDAIVQEEGTQALWSWSRSGPYRSLSRHQLKNLEAPGSIERAWQWMEQCSKLRLAAITQPGAVPAILPYGANAVITWLDHAPVEEHARVLPMARELAAAIPNAVRLGPDAMWREGWASSCLRAAALMPAAEASPFCQTVERALFGQPAGRDWTDGELAMQKALKAKIQP